MMKTYQRLSISTLLLLGLSFLTIATAAYAAESGPARSPQPSEGQSKQRPDRKPQRPRIDFAAAAAKLGTTEAKLKAALGLPARPPQEGKPSRAQPTPPQSGQATSGKGEPRKPEQGRPPRLDIKGAAAKLGVTEQKLLQALGLPEKPPMQNQPGAMQPTK